MLKLPTELWRCLGPRKSQKKRKFNEGIGIALSLT